MPTRTILNGILIVTLVMVAMRAPSLAGEKKQSQCTPELIPRPALSKEEQKKAREVKAQGMVAISISEEGDVVDAKVVRASSPEAADAILSSAKSMKFKPRPGCGIFKTAINFTLAGH